MENKVITANPFETLEIKWDGERFALVHHSVVGYHNSSSKTKTIILNPREMKEIVNFVKEVRV